MPQDHRPSLPAGAGSAMPRDHSVDRTTWRWINLPKKQRAHQLILEDSRPRLEPPSLGEWMRISD